jgi:hypothetical protein
MNYDSPSCSAYRPQSKYEWPTRNINISVSAFDRNNDIVAISIYCTRMIYIYE